MTREDIAPISMEATQTIISLEVAEMLGTRHGDLIAKINKIDKDFSERKIPSAEYWLESQYLDAQKKHRKCYNITKKGCEFLAHKTTGTKGNIFTARYMERFEQMEKALKVRAEPPRQELSDMEILSRAVLISNSKIQDLQGQVEELKPKAEFADYFLSKPGDISVDELSQILNSNNLINFGYIKLFQWLRDNKYVKKSYDDNVPTQRSLNLKIMRVAEKTYEVEGVTFIKKQTRITPKGVEYFIKKFKEAKDVRNDK